MVQSWLKVSLFGFLIAILAVKPVKSTGVPLLFKVKANLTESTSLVLNWILGLFVHAIRSSIIGNSFIRRASLVRWLVWIWLIRLSYSLFLAHFSRLIGVGCVNFASFYVQ